MICNFTDIFPMPFIGAWQTNWFPLIRILAFKCPVNLASSNSLGSLKNSTLSGGIYHFGTCAIGQMVLHWGQVLTEACKMKKRTSTFWTFIFLKFRPIKQLLYSKCFGFWNEDSDLFRLRPLQVYSIDVWFCKTSNEDLFLLKS